MKIVYAQKHNEEVNLDTIKQAKKFNRALKKGIEMPTIEQVNKIMESAKE